MARRSLKVDGTLVLLLGVLIVGGCLIFSSAVLGILARDTAPVSSILLNHLGLGVGLGLVLLVFGASINYRHWRTYAPYIFGLALVASALVFVPHLGFAHGGARRWIAIGPASFQPAEALKLASIMLAAYFFSTYRTKIGTWLYGVGGYLGIIALPALILIAQPDTGTLGLICLSVLAIYFAAGGRLLHIAAMILGGILIIGVLAFTRPYVLQRIETLINPASNPLSSGYQIRQSFIAIGSGGATGRGFGQSVQKFSYLPEPIGDSIFAVAAEEFGFLGGTAIVLLFLFFGLRSFRIASRAPDFFGALLAVGIGTYLAGEAFVNIASMVGLAPLTGVPLTFVSQGGTAMLVALASAGILLNISRNRA